MKYLNLLFLLVFISIRIFPQNGLSWTLINNSKGFGNLLCVPPNTIYTGTDVYMKSTNQGISWDTLNWNVPTYGKVYFFNNCFFVYRYNGLYRSTTSGTFERMSGFPNDEINYVVMRKMIVTKNNVLLGSASRGVYVSSDNGSSWLLKINGQIVSLEISSNNIIYVGSTSGNLFSTDDGITWQTFNYPATSGGTFIRVNNKNGYIFACNNGHDIDRSTDNGQTWTRTAHTITGSIQSFIIDRNGVVIISDYQNGLITSTDNLNSFQRNFDNLPCSNTIVNINSDSLDYIYVNSLSNVNCTGYTYRTTTPITVLTNIDDEISNVKNFQLQQNYPNPFNPTTSIEYSIPSKERVMLRIYDILGREVKVLVNEIKEAGNYKVQLNASSLPSGVYFYKLNTDSYSSLKKMILLK